jgi:hypothetical protein
LGTTQEIHLTTEERRSPLVRVGAIACAVLVAVALVSGYFILNRRQQQRALAARQAAEAAKKVAPPVLAQVYENEARLQAGQAQISGVVRNVSNARLDDLAVELQLIPRAGENLKTERLKLEPAGLNPGEEGRYAYTLDSHLWSATRLVRIVSGAEGAEIGFKTQLGSRRPLEEPATGTKVVVVPRQRGKGDDFINTPDNPIPIR